MSSWFSYSSRKSLSGIRWWSLFICLFAFSRSHLALSSLFSFDQQQQQQGSCRIRSLGFWILVSTHSILMMVIVMIDREWFSSLPTSDEEFDCAMRPLGNEMLPMVWRSWSWVSVGRPLDLSRSLSRNHGIMRMSRESERESLT